MRLAITAVLVLIAAAPARADEPAIANLGDALAYMVACPGRLWYDRNVMRDYAEEHDLKWEEGTPDFAKVEARAKKTADLLIARPMSAICVEGYRYFGTFGTKAPRFLTWW
jgi:hypothetical protein